MAEKTTIDAPDEKPKKKPAAKKKNSKIAFTPKEVELKLDIIFKLVARISGREYEYQAKDFDQEAAGLVRLAEKYDLVNTILVMFDPVVVISGLVTKFIALKKTPGTMKDKENKENTLNPKLEVI